MHDDGELDNDEQESDPAAASRLGKATEYLVAALTILATGGELNVSTSLVDDEGVDLVFHARGKTTTLAVQVKSRTTYSRLLREGRRLQASVRSQTFTPRPGLAILFVAVDDHARIGFTDMYPDEGKASAVQFLQNTVAYFRSLGVHAKRILTDNGSAFRAKTFAAACRELKLKHSFTRPYRPQTNGKAERFIQSALREWAYGIPYNHSSERTAMLERWTHHYNWHRPHQGIKGLAPINRLPLSHSSLLTLHN